MRKIFWLIFIVSPLWAQSVSHERTHPAPVFTQVAANSWEIAFSGEDGIYSTTRGYLQPFSVNTKYLQLNESGSVFTRENLGSANLWCSVNGEPLYGSCRMGSITNNDLIILSEGGDLWSQQEGYLGWISEPVYGIDANDEGEVTYETRTWPDRFIWIFGEPEPFYEGWRPRIRNDRTVLYTAEYEGRPWPHADGIAILTEMQPARRNKWIAVEVLDATETDLILYKYSDHIFHGNPRKIIDRVQWP